MINLTGAGLELSVSSGTERGARELNYPLAPEWADVVIIISPGLQRRATGTRWICGCSGGVDFIGQATSLLIRREKKDKSRSNWCQGSQRDDQRKSTQKSKLRMHADAAWKQWQECRFWSVFPMSRGNKTSSSLEATNLFITCHLTCYLHLVTNQS